MWKFAQLDLLRRLDQSVSSVTDTFRRLWKTVGDFPRAVHKTVCPVCQIHTPFLHARLAVCYPILVRESQSLMDRGSLT